MLRSPFVGRTSELSQLEQLLEQTRAGSGAVVLVGGPLGIGKTRLVEELCERAEQVGAVAVRGAWYESNEIPAYLGIADALAPLTTGVVAASLDRRSPYVRALANLGPEFAAAFGGQPPASQSQPDEQHRLWRGAAMLLQAAAQTAPTLVALDDLQWSDNGSLDLLSYLGREIKARRVLIVGCYREEDVTRDHPLHRLIAELASERVLQHIRLDGLSREEVGALVAFVAKSDVAAELVDVLHDQTEGNPLFLEELVRHVLPGGGASARDAIRAADLEVPQGLREIVGRRLSLLPVSCRALVKIAAVIGRDFELPVVQLASDLSAADLLRALDEAAQAFVIREVGPGRFTFAHPIMRNVAYGRLAPTERGVLHLRVAKAIETAYCGGVEGHVRDIARHLSAAGGIADPATTVDYALRGARQARTLFAFEEGLTLLTTALKSLEAISDVESVLRAEIWLELGYAHAALGHIDEAVRNYGAALAVFEADGDEDGAMNVRRWLVGCLAEYGRTAEALDVTREGLAKAKEQQTHAYHSLVGGHVVSLLLNGRVAEAAPWVQKVIDLAFDRESRAVATHAAGIWHSWGGGERDKALDLLGESEALNIAGGFDGTAAQISCNHAVTAYFLGRFDLVQPMLAKAEELARSSGRPSVLADRHALRSLLHVHGGEWELAERERQLWRQAASVAGGSTVWGQIARRGEALEQVWRRGPDAGRSSLNISFMLNPPLLPFLAIEGADLHEATRALGFLEKLVPAQGRGLLWLAAALPIAAALCSLRRDETADWRDPLGAYSGCLFDWFLVDIELGRIDTFMQRWDEAEGHFLQAKQLCLERGFRPFLGQVYYQHALMLLARRDAGDRRRAFSMLDEAAGIFSALRMDYMHTKVQTVLQAQHRGRPLSAAAAGLTERELAVLTLLAEGKSNHEIASQLFVTDKTVEHHLAGIYGKLGVHGRAAAVVRALRDGIV